MLGTAIHDIAVGARATKQLSNIAGTVLEWLPQQTGERSALNVREGDHHRVAATALSQQRIFAYLRLGDKAPLHATPGGQVMLAYLPPAALDDYLSRARFERCAKNSQLSAQSLREKLDQIRSDGFAKVVDEFTPRIGSVARPFGVGAC